MSEVEGGKGTLSVITEAVNVVSSESHTDLSAFVSIFGHFVVFFPSLGDVPLASLQSAKIFSMQETKACSWSQKSV